jgi:hypothetical protein
LERAHRRQECHFAVPRSERQKIPQGDRAHRRHRVVELAVDRAQDPTVRELRQPFIDGIVQPEFALLDEDHRGDCSDRLRHRGQAEDRVAPHRCRAVERQPTDRINVLRTPPADERDETRQAATVDVALQDVVQPRQPRGR